MAVPEEMRERAIYHLILADMHRLQGTLLQLKTAADAETAAALQEHFGRDRDIVLGRLAEWRQRKPDTYREAHEDFRRQIAAN